MPPQPCCSCCAQSAAKRPPSAGLRISGRSHSCLLPRNYLWWHHCVQTWHLDGWGTLLSGCYTTSTMATGWITRCSLNLLFYIFKHLPIKMVLWVCKSSQFDCQIQLMMKFTVDESVLRLDAVYADNSGIHRIRSVEPKHGCWIKFGFSKKRDVNMKLWDWSFTGWTEEKKSFSGLWQDFGCWTAWSAVLGAPLV